MIDVQLSVDQRDALQEVANIGMGQAGAALARILDAQVILSIPRIQVVHASNLEHSIKAMMGAGSEDVTAVRQSFRADVEGEAIVVYGEAGCAGLWDLMGYEQGADRSGLGAGRELLFDVANILIGACIGSIFQQLGRSLSFSAPSLVAQNVPVEGLLDVASLPWKIALLLEVNFGLIDRQFTCHLLTLMPEASIHIVKRAVDEFMNNL
jgi:chemotaxis protein CheC